jgi:hypothetical protein
LSKDKPADEARDDRGGVDPGPETPDPAPWLGQVGEGATEQSGEVIARELRELEHPHDRDVDENDRTISADPEMPIPDPGDERS